MEKRILLAVCATLAFTGQIQSNAAILNAASRFMITSAGIGGASLYAAEKYPTAFNRVGYLVSGSAKQAPITPDLDPSILMMKAQTDALAKALEGPSLTREMMPFVLKSGAVALTAFIAWDFTCGNGYTRKLIKALEEKLETLSNNTKTGFTKLNEKLKLLYRKLLNLEQQNEKTQENIEHLEQQHHADFKKLDSKVNALLKITLTKNDHEVATIVQQALNTECSPTIRTINRSKALQTTQEQQIDNDFMNSNIEWNEDPESIDENSTEEVNQQQVERTSSWWSRGKKAAFAFFS